MAATEQARTKTGGYKNIREYLAALEEAGMLKHVTAEVDLTHEIGAIAARSLEEGGPALIFENIKGYPGMPLAVNMVSYRAMIKDKNTVSWSGGTRSRANPSGGDHILMNEERGKETPVAIVLGMDPYLSLATGSPVPADEEGQTEYEAAGAWRGEA